MALVEAERLERGQDVVTGKVRMVRVLALGLVSVIALAPPIGQQTSGRATTEERADFSGTWRIARIPQPGAVTGSGNSPTANSLRVGPAAEQLVISQDAKALTIEEHYSVGVRVNTVTYALDGREITNQVRLTTNTATRTIHNEMAGATAGLGHRTVRPGRSGTSSLRTDAVT